jgi:hypothetical protein
MSNHYQSKKNQQKNILEVVFSAVFQGVGLLFKSLYRLIFLKNRRPKVINRQFYLDKWQEIETLAGKTDDSLGYQAIINADKLMDHLLIDLGLSGNNTGDRLRLLEKHSDRELVQTAWSAHKVRNQLVHQVGHQINKNQIERTIADFRKIIFALIK